VVGAFLFGWFWGKWEGLRLKFIAFVHGLLVQWVIVQLCPLTVSVMNTIVTCLAERTFIV